MDAYPCLMGLKILTFQEVYVIGRHHRHACGGGEVDHLMQILFILGAAGALHFYIESPGKQTRPLRQRRLGGGAITGQQRLPYIAALAA